MRIISLSDLEPGMVLGKTVIGNQGQVLLRQGVVLTERYIESLKAYPLVAVYIVTDGDIVAHDVISDETRLKAIEGTRDMLLKVKRGANLELEKINEVFLKVIDELLLRDDIMINLVELRSFSEDLFSHSANVAILSVILGIELCYATTGLKALAQAALLHDIGYLFLKDQPEVAHVEAGVRFLRKSGVDPLVVEAIGHHHERWDGLGYPNMLKGPDINELARLIRVANAFDSLSTNNRYPMEEVIEYLMANSGHEFEPRCVRVFINCVSFYPVGTRVELNTGESGVVIKANKGFPTRPVIRIERNMYGDQVEQGYVVNLLEKTTYFVIRRCDETPM